MEKKLKMYTIRYASGLLRTDNYRQEQNIYSSKELQEGDFVVVEHIGCGVFIGIVVDDVNDAYENWTDKEIMEDIQYRYLQPIDLSSYMDGIERAKRKKELKAQMTERFKQIDEEQKFKYYAGVDDELKVMYDEYMEL